MKYELFYATGGHGGPYEGKAAALEAARRLVGGANGSYIDVVPYSQPWEATPVRDLHLLRGVERVYDRERRATKEQWLRRYGYEPNPDSHLWHVVDREKFFGLYRELEKTDAQSADLFRLSAQELEGRMEVDDSTQRVINRLRNLVSRSGGSAAAQRNQVLKIANELGLKLPSYSFNPAESIYVMKAGEGNYYARRTTKPPKYLRWELQLPDPRSWGGGMKRAYYRPAGGKLYSRSGLSARFETLKEIKKGYPGDWRKVQ